MKELKKILSIVLVGIMIVGIPAAADTKTWTGQGADNGVPEDVQCSSSNSPNLLWIFTFDHYTLSGTPMLTLSGSGSGSYVGAQHGNEYHFETPYFAPTKALKASVSYNVAQKGNGQLNLVISHGCPGKTEIPEFSTMALPLIAIVGLIFLFQRRKGK